MSRENKTNSEWKLTAVIVILQCLSWLSFYCHHFIMMVRRLELAEYYKDDADKLSGGMLAWLCVWVKVQICIWPSWCHCHSLSLDPVNPDSFYLPGFTFLVPAHPGCPGQNARGPWNGCECMCVCACVRACVRACDADKFKHCTVLEEDRM